MSPRFRDPLGRVYRDVGSGREEPLLVRVPVDRVVEQVGANTAVVEERVPLSRRPVADDLLPLAAELDQQVEQCPLRLLDVLCEARVTLDGAQALLDLVREEPRYGTRRLVRSAGVLGVDPQGAAVRRKLFHVVYLQVVRPEDLGSGGKGEVREVLVVDRVVLDRLQQAQQVRELEGDRTFVPQEDPRAGNEVVQVGDLGEHVVADDQAGAPLLGRQLPGGLPAEEGDESRHAAFLGGGGDICRGVDPQDLYARAHEVLEEIPVVRGNLDDEVGRAEIESVSNHLDVEPRVLDPGRRVGGEVRVLREDLVGGDERLELNEVTALAGKDVQRIERLHPPKLVSAEIALAERRHPEVDNCQPKRRTAESA